MVRVLITGVAGFIGSHVARRFLQEGYAVTGVDDFSSGRTENIPSSVDFIEGDLAMPATIAKIPPGCRKILHLAGQSSGEISFDNPVADLHKNTITTLNLIQYGIQHQVERFLYASSMSVYGAVSDMPVRESAECRPLSCYGIGKQASEGYLRVFEDKLPSVILRMFNVYGPWQDLANLRQGMVSIFLAQALSTGRIEVKGSLERFRDIIYIEDVVEAWFRAATLEKAKGCTLNIGTGVKTTVGDLLNRICNLVPGASYFVNRETPGDQSGIYADLDKFKEIIGLNTFTTLDVGLDRFTKWAQDRPLSFSN